MSISSSYTEWIGLLLFFLFRHVQHSRDASLSVLKNNLITYQKPELLPSKKGLNINMATSSDVIKGLTGMIEGALKSSESNATKTRLHTVATVLGMIGDELAPLLENKWNISELFGAIQRVENGVIEAEGGIQDLLTVLHKKSEDEATAS